MYMCNTVLYIFITCFSYHDIIVNRDIYKKIIVIKIFHYRATLVRTSQKFFWQFSDHILVWIGLYQ